MGGKTISEHNDPIRAWETKGRFPENAIFIEKASMRGEIRLPPPLRLSDADFVWALGSLCQLHRVPFDPALLLQQFPPPCDRSAILGAAKALDFKIGESTVSGDSLMRLPLP